MRSRQVNTRLAEYTVELIDQVVAEENLDSRGHFIKQAVLEALDRRGKPVRLPDVIAAMAKRPKPAPRPERDPEQAERMKTLEKGMKELGEVVNGLFTVLGHQLSKMDPEFRKEQQEFLKKNPKAAEIVEEIKRLEKENAEG